jgi:hypothetical protein
MSRRQVMSRRTFFNATIFRGDPIFFGARFSGPESFFVTTASATSPATPKISPVKPDKNESQSKKPASTILTSRLFREKDHKWKPKDHLRPKIFRNRAYSSSGSVIKTKRQSITSALSGFPGLSLIIKPLTIRFRKPL